MTWFGFALFWAVVVGAGCAANPPQTWLACAGFAFGMNVAVAVGVWRERHPAPAPSAKETRG